MTADRGGTAASISRRIYAFRPYNRMQMQLGSEAQIPDGLLAANALLSENSHQGVPTSTHALYQGFGFVISNTALGLKRSLYDEGVGSRYTGKERDSESGLDYFGARYYESSMGRFISPDWSTQVEPVPYSRLNDPQTLNLYSYVRNNPLILSDPDGHVGEDVYGSGGLDSFKHDPQRNQKIGARQQQMAQQQYGRQADGSYKADPSKVQAAIDAGKPIHEPGNPDQKSECVFACKFLAQMKNIGTGQWRKGRAAAGLNDTTDIGLAIATLGSGTYPSQHGNSGIYMGHDANGGIKIVDQWPNNGPEYNHPFEHTLTRHDQGPAMDPGAYFVIMVPKP